MMDFTQFQSQHVELDQYIYEEGLRDWFGKSKSKDGKKGWVNVVTGDSCASDKPGEGVPKCVSSSKRASMSKSERESSAAKKRREDPGQQKKSGAAKPTHVKTDVKEACWDTHEKRGMKKKGGKMVPNCVPKGSVSEQLGRHTNQGYRIPGVDYSTDTYAHNDKIFGRNKPGYKQRQKSGVKDRTGVNYFNREDVEVTNTFAMYLVERGLNEYGVDLLMQDMGLVEFVSYAHNIYESCILTEGKRRGGASYEAVKAKVDSEDAARKKAKKGEYATTPSAKAKYGDEDNTVHDDEKPAKKKATVKKTESKEEPKKEKPKSEKRVEKVEKAEKEQPKKRPILDRVAKHVLKGIERHNKAMSGLKKGADTAKKVGKGVGHVASEFGKGVGSVGKAVQDTKKALTKEDAFEMWFEDAGGTYIGDKNNPNMTRLQGGSGNAADSKSRYFSTSNVGSSGFGRDMLNRKPKPRPQPQRQQRPSSSRSSTPNADALQAVHQNMYSTMNDAMKRVDPQNANYGANPYNRRSKMWEGAWQRKEGKNPEGGLNEKGRKSYERENPGSDLKAPQPEGGARKKSFCARMGGVKGPMKDEKGEPTRKALALRKWKC
jgi:hypothetical protein